MSVQDAFKSYAVPSNGTIYGFKTVVDAKKNILLRPSENFYVVPKPVGPTDVTIHSAGYFVGLQAAAFPETKMNHLKPVLVVHHGGKKANFEPKQGSLGIRFIAAKNINIGIDQVVRMW